MRRITARLLSALLLLLVFCPAVAFAATQAQAPENRAPMPVIAGGVPSRGADSAASPAMPAVIPSASAAVSANATGTPSALPDINLSWGGYFQALAIVCFCLALLWAVLWLLKRRGGFSLSGASAPGLKVENRLALGPNKWILVVRYQERRLIVGVTDKSIRLLSEMGPDDPVPGNAEEAAKNADAPSGLSFASLLKKDKNPSEKTDLPAE
jgi:flagellar protein FliO/FliZ